MRLRLFSSPVGGSDLLSLAILLYLLFNVTAYPTKHEIALARRDLLAEGPHLLGSSLAARGTTKKTHAKAPKTKAPRRKTGSKGTKPKKPTKVKKPTKNKKPTTPKESTKGKKKIPSEAEIQKQFKVPTGKTIPLFWSGTSAHVTAYRKTNPDVYVDSEVYPKSFIEDWRDADGRLNAEFAKRFSIVFAKSVPGPTAMVMVPWKGGPAKGRTFNDVEWPIIKSRMAKGEIKQLWQINPDDPSEKREYDPKVYGLKRSAGLETTLDPDHAPWDVNLDELAAAYQRKYESEL